MSIYEAMVKAANGRCQILGHQLQQVMDKDGQWTGDVDVSMWMKLFFIPAEIKDEKNDLALENMGQYSNDLAYRNSKPALTEDEYAKVSYTSNIVQSIWKVVLNEEMNWLEPT